MRNLLWLAWQYIAHHRWQSMVAMCAIAICLLTPLSLNVTVEEFRSSLATRSEQTPMAIGSRGSRFDLAFHAMHFETSPPADCSMQDCLDVLDSRLALAIPIHCRFTCQEFPVVGTSLDYFDFRRLKIEHGRGLQRLGDCVLGAKVAAEMELSPNDRLLTDPVDAFDLGGSFPLDLRVVGVLSSTNSADDQAVFVDVKTSWVIAGIGHGHVDLRKADPQDLISNDGHEAVASDRLVHHTRITDQNVNQFHFHGDESSWPLTAIIAVPIEFRASETDHGTRQPKQHRLKSETILEGRYVDPKSAVQLVRPPEVFKEVMQIVVRFQELGLMIGWLLLGLTVLFLGTTFALNRRIRHRELQTMADIGCARSFLWKLQLLEFGFVLLGGFCLAAIGLWAIVELAPTIVRNFQL